MLFRYGDEFSRGVPPGTGAGGDAPLGRPPGARAASAGFSPSRRGRSVRFIGAGADAPGGADMGVGSTRTDEAAAERGTDQVFLES